MRRIRQCAAALGIGLALVGCGGGQQQAEPAGEPALERGQIGDQLIPDEKYDEIKATFDRKATSVSRCYVEGVEAGEVDRSDKGHVTVGLTINPDGSPSDVRVMESSFKSSKVGDCVVRHVSGWTFTTLPKSLETSHTYVLDRL
ncbi:MAG TPA: AgmX/PglI C-terminal domain-containing protein [Kofleriaceae bacterium]|nr:AgmX/PglI C-terminal domain-containing protein [Kofleriaceae bacterium]